MLAGTVVGVMRTAPPALVELRTGGAVSGVCGRLVGSGAGLPRGGMSYGVGCGLLAAATVAGWVCGYRVRDDGSARARRDRLRPRLHHRRAAGGGRLAARQVPAGLAARCRGRRAVRAVARITLLNGCARCVSGARYVSRPEPHATRPGLMPGLLKRGRSSRSRRTRTGRPRGATGRRGPFPATSSPRAAYTVAVAAKAAVFAGHHRSRAGHDDILRAAADRPGQALGGQHHLRCGLRSPAVAGGGTGGCALLPPGRFP